MDFDYPQLNFEIGQVQPWDTSIPVKIQNSEIPIGLVHRKLNSPCTRSIKHSIIIG